MGEVKKFSVEKSVLKYLGSAQFLQSPLVSRAILASSFGKTFGGNRDIYATLGYRKNIIFGDMREKYDREHIAARIVDAPASATWNHPPILEIKDEGDNKRQGKEFLEIWNKLTERLDLYSKFERADKLAGIGEYSILLIGLRASGSMESNPTKKLKGDDIMYLSPFSQENSAIQNFVDDPTSPRFSEVEFYNISSGKQIANLRSFQIKTHWSRVLHFADNLLENEVYGLPRLLRVFNLFDDLGKVVGGSAEFYWRIADRGMQAMIDPDMELDKDDEKNLSDEIDEYVHGMRRFIRTRGVELKSLGSETADPRGPFQNIISLISGATGIPQRILLGSERGQLASSQDKASWNEKIVERQRLYAGPVIVRTFVDRLISWNILPDLSYIIKWPVITPQTDEERSIIAVRISSAAKNLANAKSAGGKIISDEEFRERYLDLPGEAKVPELVEKEKLEKKLIESGQMILPGILSPDTNGDGEKDDEKDEDNNKTGNNDKK